jgi:hypothetical protein
MDYKISKVSQLKQLLDLKTNVMDGGTIRLFQNDFTPSADSILADFTIATFTGYLNVTLTAWSAPYLNSAGNGAILSPLAQFNAASPYTIGNLVYGYFILDAAGDLVLGGRFTDAPISMAASGNHIAALLEYALGNPA